MSETNGVDVDESKELDKLAAALAKAQAAIKHADPSRTAPINREGTKTRRYATLADVMDASRPALAANGLAIVQHPSGSDGVLILTTWLLHESGQWMRSRLSVPYVASAFMSETQALGSAITYCRRYSWEAITGVAVEDDDAESTKRESDGDGSGAEAHAPVAPTTLPNFGKMAGQPIAGAAVKDLEFYAKAMRESLDNPEKARFKAKNSAMLGAIEAELKRQTGSGQPKPEGAPKAKPDRTKVYDEAVKLLKAAEDVKRVGLVLTRAYDSGVLTADDRVALAGLANQRQEALRRVDPSGGDEDHGARAENTDDAPF